MKKILLLWFLLFASYGHAFEFHGGQPVAAGGDVCASDGLLVAWHMEDEYQDTDYYSNTTEGTPPGCSVVGDSIWWFRYGARVNGDSVSDGDYALYDATGSYQAELNPIENTTTGEGRALIDFKIVTAYVDDTYLIYIKSSGSDSVSIRVDNSDIDLYATNTNTGGSSTLPCDTNLSADTWYRLEYQWDPALGGTNEHKLTVFSLNDSNPREVSGTVKTCLEDDDLDVLDATINKIEVGAIGGSTKIVSDNFKYYVESGL